MKTLAVVAVLLLTSACTQAYRDHSGREAARSECNRQLDNADRERCLKRVDDMYGTGPAERRDPPTRP